eukprot:CAMPEP_0171940618 /NCGR_PEP_ID=MMETSP0993-20121228/37221_1 /TAXON_ID=483369 /ORGANISM="non described non described, Strain CCMP2098" /LENGTH=87 /DNA_ID=CAMNT_0012582693 /DNA_START=370 /DNA_END=629 /DNA_ORIENTATION=+
MSCGGGEAPREKNISSEATAAGSSTGDGPGVNADGDAGVEADGGDLKPSARYADTGSRNVTNACRVSCLAGTGRPPLPPPPPLLVRL